MLQGLLRGEGLETARLQIATLMKKMGIEATYRRPNTPKPPPSRKVYHRCSQVSAVSCLCASHPTAGPQQCGARFWM